MNDTNFDGLFPLLVQFNSGLYQLCSQAPAYVGKIFVGAFYGIVFGFILSVWRNEIIHNSLLLSSSLWLLSILNCITIEWKQIFFILGVSSNRMTVAELGQFINIYLFEFVIAIFTTILFYTIISKYKNQ